MLPVILGSRPAPPDGGANRPPDRWSGRVKLSLARELWLGRASCACGTVATGELLDAAGRVDELLLTGEIGMAGGADTDLEIVAGRAGLVSGTAGADDRRRVIVGMKTVFHKWSLLK